MTAPHTPTGDFPDFDGSRGQGPMLIQAGGEPLSSDITFKSTSTNRGTLAKLIDGCDYLWKKTGANLIGTTIVRTLPLHGHPSFTQWTLVTSGGTPVGWVNSTHGNGFDWSLHIHALPHGATLTEVGIWWVGGAGHSALPTTMPQIKLAYVPPAQTLTVVGSATDTSATTTAYQQAHAIAITGLNHVVDLVGGSYELVVAGEAGTNALDTSGVYGAYVKFVPARAFAF